jgi:tetratricopeptide (TPR) repeat protein
MAKKKKKQVFTASQQETAQSRSVLERYHQIAGDLRKSASRKQVEEVMGEINALPEAAQMALAKALSREQHTDAADLLVGINELGSQKNARKEAKRSLIQLESQRIYPNWKAPVEAPMNAEVFVPISLRRFWKGQVTDTFKIGQVDMLLCWEQGTGYKRLLVMGFLLDFKAEGVKDFLTYEERKDDFDDIVGHMPAEVPLKSCSLAEGSRLLRRALDVTEQFGRKLPADYRRNQSLITQLILEAPGLEDVEEEEEKFDFLDEDEDELEVGPDLSGLEPTAVVTNFVDFWARDEFELAYRLLSSDSPLREGLSEEEWSEQRAIWAEEHDTGDLKPDFAEERKTQKSKLWLPRMRDNEADGNTRIIEAGWSIDLEDEVVVDEDADEESFEQDEGERDDAPASKRLLELPTASAIYRETGRHWFLASYTLVKDEGEWRIQSITDEAALLRQLSVEALSARVNEINRDLNEYMRKHQPARIKRLSSDKTLSLLSGMMTMMMRLSYVVDAFIAKDAEVDLSVAQSLASILSILESYERSLFFMDYIAQHSSDEKQRIANLRATATMRQLLSRQYDDEGYEELAGRFREMAEQEYLELLEIEEDAALHISLAEVLLGGERLVEAEDHLLRAKDLTTGIEDLAHIEMHLGEVAMDRGLLEEGLTHYQRIAEMLPNEAESWVDLAKVYIELDNQQEAKKHFRHAIALDPRDADTYLEFSEMFQKAGAFEKAIEVLEEGQKANPDSIDLSVMLVTLFLQIDDRPGLERAVNHLARLDPHFPGLAMIRSVLSLMKTAPKGSAAKTGLPLIIMPPRTERPKKRH